MDPITIKDLIKSRIPISHSGRDSYILAVAKGVIKELEEEKGLILDDSNDNHLMFVVDYATWRFQNRDSKEGMPRDLQFRLHNMMIHAGSDASV